jgi:tetratricopeptide (TPR) repeat protein
MSSTRLPALNPYDFSHPVRDPLLLAGRRQHLSDANYYLEQAAASDQPVCLALIGPRAAGKTSVLNAIEAMAADRKYLVVRVDLDNSDTSSPLAFFHRVIEEAIEAALNAGAFGPESEELRRAVVSLAYGEPDVASENLPLRVARAWAAAVRANTTQLSVSSSIVLDDLARIHDEVKRPVVILIDEADTMSAHPAVLQKLRNVFQRALGFTLVLAGTDELFPELDRVFSPVSRQFKTMVIGAFAESRDTEDCVLLPLRKAGLDPTKVLEPDTNEQLHDIARGRPYEVNLLCHFMFRRVQEGMSDRMHLDMDVLEAVRHELERERNIAEHPILIAVRELDEKLLGCLSILVEADRNATLEELWQAEYAIYGNSRYTQQELIQGFQTLVGKAVVHDDNGRVAFSGDEFDRLYVTYFAQARGIDLVFPPMATFALEEYWKATARFWLRKNGLLAVGPMRSGDERKQLDDFSLVTLLNALSGVTEDMALVEQNLNLALDLYVFLSQPFAGDSLPMYRVRLSIGSVDITGLFGGPILADAEAAAKLNDEMYVVQRRLQEMGGGLETESFMLPAYAFDRIAANLADHGDERLRRLLANLHASLATDLYASDQSRGEAAIQAELAYRYGADVWPKLANNLGYILMTSGRVKDAVQCFRNAVAGVDGSDWEPLVKYNMSIAAAQLADFDRAIEGLEEVAEMAKALDEQDRLMMCLVVGRIVDGKLTFAEVDAPDIAVATIESRAAFEVARSNSRRDGA